MRVSGTIRCAACVAFVLGLRMSVAHAAGKLAFEVIPPNRVEFNYPDPPREGRADYFTIAEGGRARCMIIRSARPSGEDMRAAATLKAYLDLATGADIAHRYEGSRIPDGMGVIYVGNTTAGLKTKLGLPPVRYGDDELPNVNGYLIKTLDPKTLVIRGQTDRATMLGVIGFLKRYVGVRRYWPGSPGGIGDVIPNCPTLRVPEVEWRDWPYFISRIMSGLGRHGPRPDPKYRNRVRFDDFCRMNYTIPSNESYYKWLPITKYGPTNPKYFPLIGGKRYVPKIATSGSRKGRDPHGWQPCISNREIVGIMANGLIDYFQKNPDRFAINLAVNDGGGDCQCAECRAMDPPNADVSTRSDLCDRYVKFDNQVCDLVAQEFPNKIVAFIAYGSMREPPTTVRLHRMLMPVLCVGGNTFEMWDKWMTMGAKRMGVYFYHDDVWFFMPKMDIHQSAKRIRYIVASGRARHFYQEFYGIWPLDGMVGYVESELLWDPRLDVDAMLDEYYAKFYGPAAAPMKRFYDTLEAGYERWIEEDGIPHPHGKDNGSMFGRRGFEQFRVLSVEEANAASAHLTEALDATEDDRVVGKRLGVVKKLFDFAAIGARQYWAMRRLKEAEVESEEGAAKVIADAREAIAMSRVQAGYKRDIMEKPPANIYAGHMRDTFYECIKVGDVHPQVLAAVSSGFGAAGDFIRTRSGPEAAAAWWRMRRDAEKDPLLSDAMAISEVKARGTEIANLVRDPSFETRGAGQAVQTGLPTAPGHDMRQGLNTWHGRGTSMKCSLTTEDAHTGKYSVVFWDTQHAGIREGIAAKPGEHYHLSVWVKHNGKPARYQVNVLPRSRSRMLARTVIPIPDTPDKWHQIATDFTTPQATATMSLYVFIDAQTPGAKIWIDDFFIGKYPE